MDELIERARVTGARRGLHEVIAASEGLTLSFSSAASDRRTASR
jgi:hypothetical protein